MLVFRHRTMGLACAALCVWSAAAASLESYPLDLGPNAQADLGAHFPSSAKDTMEADGIRFAVNGTRLRVPPGQRQRIETPPQAFDAIHFLHYTEHSGAQVGSYLLNYADGEQVDVPIISGMNMQDWWKPGGLAFAALAHRDEFPAGNQPQAVGFWRFSVKNPRPGQQLASIEVVNLDGQAVINLVAVSLSGACGDDLGGVPLWAVGMDEQQLLLAVLRQQDTTDGKAQVCQQLRRAGTAQSVPYLAALLGDEQLGHPARLALEAMTYPEVDTAFREALATTDGPIRAGIIDTLGKRADAEALDLVIPFLASDDPLTARCRAGALGRIGGLEAAEALKGARGAAKGPVRAAIDDALLRCAEGLRAEDESAAHALYTDIFEHAQADHVRRGAYRGMILTAGSDAMFLAVSALMGDDALLWQAALPAVWQTQGREGTQALAAMLPEAPRLVVPGLIEGLGQRGDPLAVPAITAFVEDEDPAVRARAIGVLARIGDGSAVAALVKVAAHGDKDDSEAAEAALAQLSARDVPGVMKDLAKTAEPAEAAVVAKAFGQRGDKSGRPALRAMLGHEDTQARAAAITALGQIGEVGDAKRITAAVRPANKAELTAAQRALVELGNRYDTPRAIVKAILAQLNADSAAMRCAMLAVCGRLGESSLLEALDEAARDENAEVKDAAVRALADSDAPGALPYLLGLAEKADDLTHRVLALRGVARLASDREAIEASVREDAARRGLAAAERAEEKKLLLSALGGCHTFTALACCEEQLGAASEAAASESAVAWTQIANALLDVDRERVGESAKRVFVQVQEAGVAPEVLNEVLAVKRAAAALPVPGGQVGFEHVLIDAQFRSEGVAVADVNRDGLNDVLAGDVWYAAPDWKVAEVRPPQTYDPDAGYSQCFANFTTDVDEDGWMDSVIVGFPSAPALWYRNPGEAEGHWPGHEFAPSACGETPIFGDLLGDGRPVPVFAMNCRITWFRPGADRTAPWAAHPVSQELPEFKQFGHGLGMGDVNRDGRVDLLGTGGWWEAPLDRGRTDWTFHEAPLGPACADMVVYDVDGDGDNDVLTSAAHEYGVWWFEQKEENGETTFEQHEIHKAISQTHALILADMNNDGLADLVTGKRYHAHNGHDPGSAEPSILCWFELQRPESGKPEYTYHEIHNDSGVGTQFAVCDLDGDGLLDVVTSNKKGVHAFLQRRSN